MFAFSSVEQTMEKRRRHKNELMALKRAAQIYKQTNKRTHAFRSFILKLNGGALAQ